MAALPKTEPHCIRLRLRSRLIYHIQNVQKLKFLELTLRHPMVERQLMKHILGHSGVAGVITLHTLIRLLILFPQWRVRTFPVGNAEKELSESIIQVTGIQSSQKKHRGMNHKCKAKVIWGKYQSLRAEQRHAVTETQEE